MNPNSPLDNQAGRSALVSTGIVGLTSLIMKKFAGTSLKVGLPIGLGTALIFDYAVKRNKNHSAIRVANGAASAFLKGKEDEHYDKHQSAKRSDTWFSNQLVTAYVSLGSIAALGSYKFLTRQPAQLVHDILAITRPETIADIIDANRGPGPALPDMPAIPELPGRFGARKPQRYLLNSCQFLGVLLVSLHMLSLTQLDTVRNSLYDLFYVPLIDRIEGLFEFDAAELTTGARHHAIEKMMEEQIADVIGSFRTNPNQEMNLPDDISLVSIVEDETGTQMALSMHRDQAREIPIVHLDDDQVSQLGAFYDTNPEFANQLEEQLLKEQIRQTVLETYAEHDHPALDAPDSISTATSDVSSGLPPRVRGPDEPIPPGWVQYEGGMYGNDDGRMFVEDGFDDLLAYIRDNPGPAPPGWV
jgi:hypothetical protein